MPGQGGEEFNYNVDLSNQQTWCASRSHPHCHLGLPEHGQVDGGPSLGTQYHNSLLYKGGFCLLFINLSIPPVVERRTWLGVSCRSGPRIKVNFFFDNFLSPAHKQGLFLPPWNAAPVGSVQLSRFINQMHLSACSFRPLFFTCVPGMLERELLVPRRFLPHLINIMYIVRRFLYIYALHWYTFMIMSLSHFIVLF